MASKRRRNNNERNVDDLLAQFKCDIEKLEQWRADPAFDYNDTHHKASDGTPLDYGQTAVAFFYRFAREMAPYVDAFDSKQHATFYPQIADLVRQWCACCDETLLPQIPSRQLSNAIFGFHKLRLRPEAGWLDAWYDASARHLTNGDAQHYANSIFALANLSLVPPERWLQKWAQGFMKDEVQQATTTQDFANSLYALAALHAAGAQGCQEIAEEVLNELDNFLLTHWPAQSRSASSSAAEEYRLNGRNKRQIFQSCHAFGFDMPEGVLEHDGTIKYETVKNKDNPSKGEQVLKKILRNAGYQPDPPSEHPATLAEVDISLDMAPMVKENGKRIFVDGLCEQRRVFLQYDGPYHFVYGLDDSFTHNGAGDIQSLQEERAIANGNTQLNSLLIRQHEDRKPDGALLVRIPYHEVETKWHDRHQLIDYVLESIGQAALAEQQAREAGTGAPSPQCAPDGPPERLTGSSQERAADGASASPQSPSGHSARHNQRSAGGGRSSH